MQDSDGRVLAVVLMAEDVTERKASEDQIYLQAPQEPLTGLPNRALFVDDLRQALVARPTRQTSPFAGLLMELDDFGAVNGSRWTPRRATRCSSPSPRGSRRAGVRAQDTVARLGEDEFAVLLEGLDDLWSVVRVAERVGRTLPEEPFVFGGHVGVSTGVALGARSLEELREILRQARLALSEAKKRGKGWYEIFDYGMDTDGLARLRTEDELREACRQGSLWQGRYAEHVVSEVSVNLSKKQLLRADLVEKVAEVLSETGMRASGLFLEVAEDALAEGE